MIAKGVSPWDQITCEMQPRRGEVAFRPFGAYHDWDDRVPGADAPGYLRPPLRG